jgi:hypothetical protein
VGTANGILGDKCYAASEVWRLLDQDGFKHGFHGFLAPPVKRNSESPLSSGHRNACKISVQNGGFTFENWRMKHEELGREIIGAAMAVLNELKPGLDEKLYENALLIELVSRGHKIEQ